MQEQKRYQIEKVEHFGFAGGEEFIATYYYPSGKLSQSGYFSEKMARFKTPYQTGMWRIKQQDLKQSKNLNYENNHNKTRRRKNKCKS